eukprot:7377439-Prymnesium_polylepis.1
MVQNPAAEGGRRHDPLAIAEAKITELQADLKAAQAATAIQNTKAVHHRRKAEKLQKELSNLRGTYSNKENTVGCMQDPSRKSAHSTAVGQVETFMKKFDPADWVTIILGVLARNDSIYGDDEQRFMIYDIPDATAFEP